MSTGTAKPTPAYAPLGLTIWVLIPMSRPELSRSGPPEFPGAIRRDDADSVGAGDDMVVGRHMPLPVPDEPRSRTLRNLEKVHRPEIPAERAGRDEDDGGGGRFKDRDRRALVRQQIRGRRGVARSAGIRFSAGRPARARRAPLHAGNDRRKRESEQQKYAEIAEPHGLPLGGQRVYTIRGQGAK